MFIWQKQLDAANAAGGADPGRIGMHPPAAVSVAGHLTCFAYLERSCVQSPAISASAIACWY